MNSNDKKILEAYESVMSQRQAEGDTIKPEDTVVNRRGDVFVVEKTSKDFEEIAEYDKTGEARSYMKYSRLVNENTVWVGVKDKFGDVYVYPYNDEGVTLVEKSDQSDNTTHTTHQSMMEAYRDIVSKIEE